MKKICQVILLGLFSLIVFWAPFLLKIEQFWGIDFDRAGTEVIVQNFDGVNFLMVAKSWYSPERLRELAAQLDPTQEPKYYAAHYPLTAAVIAAFSQFTSGPRAVLYTILLGNVFLVYGLYTFFAEFVDKKNALWLAAIGLFLPARMLSVRGVLSSETWFIPLGLLTLVLAKREKHKEAAVLGSLAILTRSPGIILFGGIGLAALSLLKSKTELIKLWPYFLLPATLLGLWGFYGMRYGNPLAYFQSGDNLHLFVPPFRVFGTSESWVSGMWREDIIYVYVLFVSGLGMWLRKVWKKGGLAYRASVSYPALFLLTILFVSHRDIARYALPIAPFVIAGFSEFLIQKWVKWVILASLIPIYLLGWQFVLANVQPIADWTPLL